MHFFIRHLNITNIPERNESRSASQLQYAVCLVFLYIVPYPKMLGYPQFMSYNHFVIRSSFDRLCACNFLMFCSLLSLFVL